MKKSPWMPLRLSPESRRALGVELVAPGSDRPAPYKPDAELPPGVLLALRDPDHRKRDEAGAVALATPGALILRRSLTEPVVEPLVARGLATRRPVVLLANPSNEPLRRPKPLSEDWVLVDVPARFPIDRDGLDPKFLARTPVAPRARPGVFDPARAWASLVARLPERPAWTPSHAPVASLFRALELPGEIFADEEIYRALQRALGDDVVQSEAADVRVSLIDEARRAPPIPGTAEEAREAAEAFFRAARGAAEKHDRARILASPLWAYALARIVYLCPDDATRAAALRHPLTAAAYARDVDRGPREDTRQAACADPAGAIEYLRYVDRGPHPRTTEALHDHPMADDLQLDARSIREAWARASAAAQAGAAEEPRADVSGARVARREQGPSPWTVVEANVDVVPSVTWAEVLTDDTAMPLEMRLPRRVLVQPLEARGFRARVSKLSVLDIGGALLFRRAAVSPVLRKIPASELALRSVDVVSTKGELLDKGWVVLDVRAEHPLDRDSADADYRDADNPHGSFVMRIRRVAFRPDREPSASLFHVGEAPTLIVMRRALAEALKEVLGRELVVHNEDIDTVAASARIPNYAKTPEPGPAPKEASRAAEAYYRSARGEQGGPLRAAACQSSHYAYWLARNVDGAPSDDTRGAALQHPHYAAEYALFVDRGPRDDTRAAASGDAASAAFYARYVDRAVTPLLREGMLAGGYRDEDVHALESELLPRRQRGSS